mgnify:CR=1 FL=1
MAKNRGGSFSEEETDFKRIKEQRKPIKNFKTHLKHMIENEEWDDDVESIYNRKWRK